MEILNQLIDEESLKVNLEDKRIIKPGFSQERLEKVNPDWKSRRQRRNKQKESSIELEIEEKLSLDAIRLRETLDPSRFYKKKCIDPNKTFQIGTVIEHPIDYYSSRATRREQGQTLVDELINDSEFKKNVKKRFRRLRATNAIKQKEKALADRRKLLQGKKKAKKIK